MEGNYNLVKGNYNLVPPDRLDGLPARDHWNGSDPPGAVQGL